MSLASRSIRSAWLQAFLRRGIDDRADIGREQPWVAERQFGHRARRNNLDEGGGRAIGDDLLSKRTCFCEFSPTPAATGRSRRTR